MSDNWSPEDEDRLRRALHEEAAQVMPSSGGLQRIMARTRREDSVPPWWRNPAVLGVAAALIAAVAIIGGGLAVLRGPDNAVTAGIDATTAPSTPAPSPTTDSATTDPTREPGVEAVSPTPQHTSRPPAPSHDPGEAFTGAVAVYYLSDTPAGPRLVREWRHVNNVRDATTAAVALMLAEPDVPDYRSPWDPDTELRSVRIDGDSIAVDLSLPDGTAAASAPEEAELAIQQLVYTVTAAASVTDDPERGTLPVRILVDGEPVGRLWGVDVSEALGRAPAAAVRQLVQINDPAEGAEVHSPVRVRGEALAFEANLLWEVRQDGEVVADGDATTEQGMVLSGFDFEVDLEPGDYTLIIREDDPSGGEGRDPMTDERRFTVTDG